jgi:hypothetical protein
MEKTDKAPVSIKPEELEPIHAEDLYQELSQVTATSEALGLSRRQTTKENTRRSELNLLPVRGFKGSVRFVEAQKCKLLSRSVLGIDPWDSFDEIILGVLRAKPRLRCDLFL